MKRVSVVLGVLMLAFQMLVALGAPGAEAAPCDPTVQTGCPTPASKPAGDVLVTKGEGVCIALPVISAGSDQGKCKDGEIELPNDPTSGGAIVLYLKLLLKLLNVVIGMVIILMIVVAGVQYIASAGEPAAVKSAKSRLTNAFIALALYMMSFAIINFLVPGGLL